METVPKSVADNLAAVCYLVGLLTGLFVGVYFRRKVKQ